MIAELVKWMDNNPSEAVVQTQVEIECQHCMTEKLVGVGKHPHAAKANLACKIMEAGWTLGNLDSEAFQTHFTCLCKSCYNEIVREDGELEIEEKLKV